MLFSTREWPGPRQGSPRAACISIDNETPHLEMLLTDPLHKCLPGGGDAPRIQSLKKAAFHQQQAGQGPFQGWGPLARAPINIWALQTSLGLVPGDSLSGLGDGAQTTLP